MKSLTKVVFFEKLLKCSAISRNPWFHNLTEYFRDFMKSVFKAGFFVKFPGFTILLQHIQEGTHLILALAPSP